MFKDAYNKRVIHIYFLVWLFILLVIIAGFCMFKYFVKGEKNIPFKISKILIVSSAQTTNLNLIENTYIADVIQKNDIYISVEKNTKKEDTIKEIAFENFKLTKSPSIGTLEIYRPSKEEKLFSYKEEDKEDKIIYVGAQETNIKGGELQIANQGGVLNFSIVLNNLGQISYLENEDINLDGKILKKLEIPNQKLEYLVSFDVKITLESGKVFYTNIEMELPAGNILEQGVISKEYEQINNLVYKRK